jgi:hypothetical protein
MHFLDLILAVKTAHRHKPIPCAEVTRTSPPSCFLRDFFSGICTPSAVCGRRLAPLGLRTRCCRSWSPVTFPHSIYRICHHKGICEKSNISQKNRPDYSHLVIVNRISSSVRLRLGISRIVRPLFNSACGGVFREWLPPFGSFTVIFTAVFWAGIHKGLRVALDQIICGRAHPCTRVRGAI